RLHVYRQAASFAMMKKYEAKCDEWTGFGWDIGSARAVDAAFVISQAWAFDAEMERLVKDNLRPGRRIEM
ncbi:MAG: hypothetical protein ACRD4C_01500, partial [Candidatus Acidiferrales bacterium]